MKRFSNVVLFVGFVLVGCRAPRAVLAPKADTLAAADLLPYGRTMTTEGQGLELISSAAHFSFSFEGTSCWVSAGVRDTGAHNYLQYELDGVYQKRVRINGSKTEPFQILAVGAGPHTVTIYKATEAHTGPVFIRMVSGRKVRSLPPSSAPLIEFIGNSITCGAAADPADVPCGTGAYHDQHNAYYAYGPRLARALGTNFMLSSVSGIGVYRNWNSLGPTMPAVYEQADFGSGARPWNFAQYRPKLVSIALGTNDFSDGDGKSERLPFDSAAYVAAYTSFVRTVRAKYPQAQLVLLSSPMVHGARRTMLQNCLTAVKGKVDGRYPSVRQVALYFFKPMQARGCSGHPSVEDHALLAEELKALFSNLLRS